jgi:sec-independent protein translocase protein TatC
MSEVQATVPAKESLPGMSFLDHLEELRRRIIRSAIAVVVAFFACFLYADRIFRLMQRPIMVALKHNGLDSKLVYLNPTEPFNLYIKIGFMAAIFAASPYILWQVWSFIAPALYRRERRYVAPFMVCTVGLFLAGGYFGYRIVYPAALEFLIHYGKDFQPMITVHEYTDLFLAICVGLGVIFEMPILVFFLALFGIINARFMVKNFRYAILLIFIIAGIVSPTPDVMNMMIFASPMIVLYLLSIGVAWLVHPSRRKAKAEEV